ncbi:alcohol dehydrogenase catalytic domain-containing protein [Deinococcus oregonensis]|uniref:Alcohol dehydrogenase catalytic domain-containing protein n=1 Tax=Deinococcus oregonensis TaxID=1805970 RepID=A0ABV6B4T2_9DEIO
MLEYREIPDRVLQPGHGIIEMEAISLNFADLYRRRGTYHLAGEPPYIAGYEGAGCIVALADATSLFAVGDQVVFADSPFVQAERALVELDRLILAPDDINGSPKDGSTTGNRGQTDWTEAAVSSAGPRSAGSGFIVQRLQNSTPPPEQARIQANLFLECINNMLSLKLKSARDLYPLLKTDTLTPASELGRLLASSRVPLIQGYVQAMTLRKKGLKWDAFPAAVKRLFISAGVEERANTMTFFGGKASALRYRLGGEALVEGTPTDVTVCKQVKFNAIGTFPAGLSYQQAKSQFLAKSSSVWSNTHKLIMTDLKKTNLRPELPIK